MSKKTETLSINLDKETLEFIDECASGAGASREETLTLLVRLGIATTIENND